MRRRLVLVTAATTSLVLIAFVVPLALLVRSVAADRAVSAATRQAQSAASLVGLVDEQTLGVTVSQLSADPTQDYPLTVFLPDGRRLGAPAPVSDAVRLARTGRSLTADAPGGREVLVSTQGGTAGTTVVRAFVSDAQLHTGVTSSWLVLGLLAVGLFGLGLVVADRMGRSLVRDIDDLAGTAHRLSGGDLTAQSGVSEPPELAEVGRALNTLGGRITDLLRAERERAADLSHRLRTPLTLLKLEVEAVDAGADRQRLGAAVAAVERGVDRVITEARRPTERAAPAICDAASVARERAAFWQPLAEDEGRLLRTDVVDRPVPVRVGADDLAAALDALIGNVFAHAGEDAGIMITVAVLAGDGATGTAEVTVSDTGPGIPADLASRGVSGAGSTGLGLDIAAGTARSAGGTMIIDVGDRGGTAVRLRLPVTDDPIEQDVVHRSSEQPDSRLG